MARKTNKTGRITAKRVQDTEDMPVKVPDVVVKPENDDDDTMGTDGLNVRRRLFVNYLTGEAFGNASKAAELAGYASDNRIALAVTAHRLLNNPKVAEAVRMRLAEARLGANWVRLAIADYAGATMADFLSVDEKGEPSLDWAKAAAAGAIGHVREFKEKGIKHGETVEIIERSFKIRDPLPARALLARMNGLIDGEPQDEERVIRRRPMSVGRTDAGNADHN